MKEVWIVLYKHEGMIKRTAPFDCAQDAENAVVELNADGISETKVKHVKR